MSEENETCKVVLIGESGVGKTSIIKRFLDQSFLSSAPSTLGANYSSTVVNVDGKNTNFTLWDTAGQEKYRSLIKMFYNDATAAVLVYDITDLRSFNEIKNYWYKEIVNRGPKDIIIVLAANKVDLYEDEKVDETEARNYARKIGSLFIKTSAFNSNGIDDLFQEIGKKYVEKLPQPEEQKKTGSTKINQHETSSLNSKTTKNKIKCC